MGLESKVCTAIAAATPSLMGRKAERAFMLGSDLVEFRIDTLRSPDPKGVADNLSGFAKDCILTVRSRKEGGYFRGSEAKRLGLLLEVSAMKPAFSDIELSSVTRFPGAMQDLRANSGKVIVSWHDFRATPPFSRLVEIYARGRRQGQIVKMITTARRIADNATLLSLYEVAEVRSELIAFCMGERGAMSRILCMCNGSPLSYASLPRESVAPGQLPIDVMKEMIAPIESRF